MKLAFAAGLPQHVPLPGVRVPGQDEQQVRQPVQIPGGQRVDRVAERAEGRNVYYRAAPQGLEPLITWMDHYGVFWRERFQNLRDLLKEIDP